ncbi:MAG: hypothetical protein GOMPHAMPRED_000246 [Gomphillus americanus]|uniref:Metallo-beta-lactamase domain-containing protein n=1 Tax=Gomphillus americanus TaxID=1940652 RepID=A0A8H3I1C0_9LECA|nr:MAG: hypothetical protein GOMPHAMPRED_000246 [Gomphillus americanus]
MATTTLPQPDKSHHTNSSSTSFRNPWPSFKNHGLLDLLHTRFRSDRNFIPIPQDRKELVTVQSATFATDTTTTSKLKATWLGHASWLLEFPNSGQTKDTTGGPTKGVTILLDPVFADRTSPVRFLGPKRYSPLPCTLDELPSIDSVLISHNHYDHLDIDVVLALHKRSSVTVFFCPLRNKDWFVSAGVAANVVVELDWWEACSLKVPGSGCVNVVCTPSQHTSARTPFDRDTMLWSGWAVAAADTKHEMDTTQDVSTQKLPGPEISFVAPRVFFAGDTGYRYVSSAKPTPSEEETAPRCPAFKQIGDILGPFDLALLPIGLYSPRDMLSSVHCSPEDSVCIHQDVRSKRSIGMHWGTYRGGISAQYEDVREPPRRFETCSKAANLAWGTEIGLCGIGETILI